MSGASRIKGFCSYIIRKLKSVPRGFYVVTGIYLLVLLIMLPFRQLAFQDDFAYYRSVENFLQTGRLHVSEWAAPTLIFQIWWGALFSTLFGFSFKALHFSNVVIFYFGIISFYFLIKELNFGEKKATISSLFILSFPGMLRFVFSFMTDISYLSLMIISLYLAVLAIKRDSLRVLFFATVFGMIVYLDRQIGITIPISLVFVYLFKSIRDRKLYYLNLLVISVPAILIYFVYNHWLRLNDNLSQAQYIYIDKYIEYLRLYVLPRGLHRLRPTNDIYSEIVIRTGYYLQYLFGLFFTFLMFFKPPKLNKIFNLLKKHKISILVAVVVLFLLYIGVAFRVSTGKDFSFNFSKPPSIFFSLSVKYSLLWTKIWKYILIFSFPIWAAISGIGISRLIYFFFEKRSKRMQPIQKWIFFPIVCITVLVTVYFINKGVGLFGGVFIKETFFIFFAAGSALLLSFFITWFQVRTKKLRHGDNTLYLVLFIVICGLLHFGLTTLAFFAWYEEYLLPLVPFLIIGLLALFKNVEIDIAKSLLIIFPLLFFSLMITKTDYDKAGIIWETAENYVNQGLVDPREIEVGDWAWIPYFFHEESFNKRLKEVGGNKYDVGQIHTWWGYEEYKYRDAKVSFLTEPCDKNLKEGWKIIERIEAKSLFADYQHCVAVKK